jgi:hypothetical protein
LFDRSANGPRLADPIAYADQLLALVNRGETRLEDAGAQLAHWLREHTAQP